jgi:enoyl-CoA hydratase/carnithine racemase
MAGKTFMTNPLSFATSPILEIEAGVATITLNRPAQRNRLNNEDLKTLLAHFDTINEDASVRVMKLTASTKDQPKPVFCAGYDIGEFDASTANAVAFEAVPDALAHVRPVTICALNGSVYGGATDLALACDLRIGLEGIEWRMPATALGLHYYPSGLQRYFSRFGVLATQRAFLTGRPFTWQQLEKIGLFEAFCNESNWHAHLDSLTKDIWALAPMAVQETKKSLNEIIENRSDLETLRAREELTSQSEDFAEGRRAFMERRAPKFGTHGKLT